MGFGMAANLLKAGHDVLAYDVAAEPLARFAALGGRAARHPAQIGAECPHRHQAGGRTARTRCSATSRGVRRRREDELEAAMDSSSNSARRFGDPGTAPADGRDVRGAAQLIAASTRDPSRGWRLVGRLGRLSPSRRRGSVLRARRLHPHQRAAVPVDLRSGSVGRGAAVPAARSPSRARVLPQRPSRHPRRAPSARAVRMGTRRPAFPSGLHDHPPHRPRLGQARHRAHHPDRPGSQQLVLDAGFSSLRALPADDPEARQALRKGALPVPQCHRDELASGTSAGEPHLNLEGHHIGWDLAELPVPVGRPHPAQRWPRGVPKAPSRSAVASGML